MMENDPRVGVTGESEPDVCAYSGEKVQGRHANSFSLGHRRYYRVLAKHLDKWTEEDHVRMVTEAAPPSPLTPFTPPAAPVIKTKSDDLKGDKS